jgi:hypothetical protein
MHGSVRAGKHETWYHHGERTHERRGKPIAGTIAIPGAIGNGNCDRMETANSWCIIISYVSFD